MDELISGDVLEVHATDSGTQSGLTAWPKSGGHDLLQAEKEDGIFKFWIKKA